MKMKLRIMSLLALSIAALSSSAQAGTTITGWSFDSMPVGTLTNSPAASTGAGTASAIGMINSTNPANLVPESAAADIVATTGASTGVNSEAWRIRGSATNGPLNGWNSAAAIGTQGAEFDASTAGYSNITVSFDIYFTAQATANMMLEYNTNVNNANGWTNAQIVYSGPNGATVKDNTTSANTVNGYYLNQTTAGAAGNSGWYNGVTADLSLLTALSNDPNFGIRIVNASTGADNVNYAGAPLNNTSGNVRFDNVVISGTPTSVPLPAAVWLFGSALAGFMGLNRRKS